MDKHLEETVELICEDVFKLKDVRELASACTVYLQEKGYDLTIESDGSIVAVKTEYL